MQPDPNDKYASESADLRRELQRLRAVEQRFEDFANSARDFAFISLDLNNCVIGWNKGAQQVLGYSEPEILGRSGSIFFTPEDVASGEDQREITTARAHGRAEDERWHIRKDGTRFWGSGVMTLLRDFVGEVHGYAKVMRDFTEQRKHLEALRASEERFRLLVQNVRECALFQVDPAGNVSDWNPGAERIFGYEQSEVLGRSVIELFPADHAAQEAMRKELEEVAASDGAAGEAWLRRKNGSKFYARWVTNGIRDQTGGLSGFTKVLRDETEQKRHEEDRARQFQSDRELLEGQVRFTNSALDRTEGELRELAGHLLSAQEEERRSIARDLHDHFVQRLAFVEMKLGQARNALSHSIPAADSDLQVIQQQISLLSNEVRDLSYRLHPATLEHIGLLPALKSLIEELAVSGKHSVDLDADDFFDEGLRPELRAVLYRISEEALRNASRHAGDGIGITVSLARSPQEVNLRIEDRGRGFSPKAVQGRRSLGLISMEERARSVGGILQLTSVPGEGTTIDVVVPVNADGPTDVRPTR